VTAGYALFGLGAPLAGVLADSYGSQALIVVCLFGMGVSFLLLGLAPSVVVIALALVVWGAAASVYHPSGLALISKGVHERGSAFAYHGVAGNLGIALGPLAATLALIFLDWRVVVSILAVPALVVGLFALRIDIDETAAVSATDGGSTGEGRAGATGEITSLPEFLDRSKALFTGAFVLVFFVAILSGLYYRGVLTFLPEILSGVSALQPIEIAGRRMQPNRYFYVGLLMVGVLGQYAGGRLTDRTRPEWGIGVGYGALAVLAVAFAVATGIGLVALVIVGAALGFFLFFVQPQYQAAIADYSPPEARGISYGYTYFGVFGVGALGGAVAGVLLSAFSPTVLFGTLAVFGAGASILGLVLLRR
jgi:MFS family permease